MRNNYTCIHTNPQANSKQASSCSLHPVHQTEQGRDRQEGARTQPHAPPHKPLQLWTDISLDCQEQFGHYTWTLIVGEGEGEGGGGGGAHCYNTQVLYSTADCYLSRHSNKYYYQIFLILITHSLSRSFSPSLPHPVFLSLPLPLSLPFLSPFLAPLPLPLSISTSHMHEILFMKLISV